MQAAEHTLIEVGREYPVLSITSGELHPVLQQAAREHAGYQAARGVQGHQGWDARYARLRKTFPQSRISEICAESWDWETTHEAAARSMYNSWIQSPGHWETANGPAMYYGYSMAKSRRGIWYACGIVVKP